MATTCCYKLILSYLITEQSCQCLAQAPGLRQRQTRQAHPSEWLSCCPLQGAV